jgi:hypothetical protein
LKNNPDRVGGQKKWWIKNMVLQTMDKNPAVVVSCGNERKQHVVLTFVMRSSVVVKTAISPVPGNLFLQISKKGVSLHTFSREDKEVE